MATLTNLTAGTLYYVSVTAIDAGGIESGCFAPAQSAVARVGIAVSPADVNFGSVIVGSTADQTFSVQNTGSGTVSGTVSTSAPFSVVSGSPFSLAGGATQTVVVRFTPTVAASATGNVTFTASGDSLSRAVTGTGTADSTPPSVVITSPTSGATYATTSSALSLGGTASDNVGVTRVTWTNNRGGSGTATGTTSWTVGGIVLQPGTNVVTVTARDAAANAATATVTVTFTDTTAPTVALTAPAAGAAVSGTVNVTATASDNVGVAGVQFRLDGVNLGAEKTTAPYSVSWNTATASGGSHTLAAVARDAAGNTTTSTPVAVTVAAPLSVARAASPVTLDGSLAEWSGATPVQFSGRSNSATAYLLWDATNLYVAFQVSDTQLNATRTNRDAGGLYQDDSVEIYIDTRNDRASTMQPDDYQFIVNLNNVQGDLRGNGNGKASSWNATWRSAVGLQGTLNANGDSDRGYTVEVAIPWAQLGVTPVSGMALGIDLVVNDRDATTFDYFDWAGIAPNSFAQPFLWKQVSLMGTSLADTTPPSVAITAPASGATVSGAATLTAAASDNVGVVGVQFRVDGAAVGAEVTAAPYALTWNTTGVPNGPHTLTAVARDAAGNTTTSAAVTASVNNDTVPPVLSAVAASAITSSGATITWTTDEASDTQVEYGLTTAYGTLTALDATRVTAHTRTLGGLVAGTLYHYRVRSRDAAGNLGTSADFSFATMTTPTDAVVSRAVAAITVNGDLSDWSGATAVQFSGRSSSATAYLLWDATNLYVAFQVSDRQLNATRTARDAADLYQDDSVEIYIDTRGDRASTMQTDDYQFLVNLNNAQVDLRGTGTGKDPAWNGTWRSAVRLQGTLNANGDVDSGYTVEIAIPWAQIGVTPVSGMTFGLDLAVNDRTSTSFDYFDWAGIAPNSFAQPSLWKRLRLQ